MPYQNGNSGKWARGPGFIGIALGAFRFAARSLTGGSAAEAGRPEEAAANLASSTTVGLLVAPVGTIRTLPYRPSVS